MEEQELSFTACFLIKLNILLSYYPASVLLGIYPKELKTYVHIKTFTQIFTAVLFIIAKTWKPSRFPSIDDWIDKLEYNQTIKYYLLLKRNELSSYEKA